MVVHVGGMWCDVCTEWSERVVYDVLCVEGVFFDQLCACVVNK